MEGEGKSKTQVAKKIAPETLRSVTSCNNGKLIMFFEKAQKEMKKPTNLFGERIIFWAVGNYFIFSLYRLISMFALISTEEWRGIELNQQQVYLPKSNPKPRWRERIT